MSIVQCSAVYDCKQPVLLQVAHAEADPAAPKPAAADVGPADAEVAPAADKEALEAEVTPAAVDSTAASGEPIAEAMVALQEVMEPAPVPEPVLEGESSNAMPPARCFSADSEVASLQHSCVNCPCPSISHKCSYNIVQPCQSQDRVPRHFLGRLQLLTE